MSTRRSSCRKRTASPMCRRSRSSSSLSRMCVATSQLPVRTNKYHSCWESHRIVPRLSLPHFKVTLECRGSHIRGECPYWEASSNVSHIHRPAIRLGSRAAMPTGITSWSLRSATRFPFQSMHVVRWLPPPLAGAKLILNGKENGFRLNQIYNAIKLYLPFTIYFHL